jgi:LuxR family maltose regulon positive regulatory protein
MTTAERDADSSREGFARIPLLATKLHMPSVRPNLVSRPHLLSSLTSGSDNRLILLSAPAGFGKTTLLSDWLATHSWPAGWLSLDRGDNDPVRFWTYVIAALQTNRPGLGESSLALLSAGLASPMESVLTMLINDLDSTGDRCLLVLDDYHAIDNPVIHSTMSFFLDHLPIGAHVAIATRVDPPLALAHLRANGRLLELRVDKLRFTPEETSELLNERLKFGLSTGDIKILAERTEGWIVGLQLAALSLQGRTDTSEFVQALSGSHRHILDYLVEEVLSRQPVSIQAFLLQTCILERLCGPLCDALLADQVPPHVMDYASPSAVVPAIQPAAPTEQSRIHSSTAPGQSMLEYLEKANLFISPLDDERKWYRYHHLFADLLRIRLVQLYGDGHLRTLHARAARWYEENQLPAEAIEHALAAHEPDRAARVIECSADSAWLGGEFYQVLRWIEALPKELVRSRPWLCIWYAWSRLQAGAVDGIEELVDDAEQAARAGPGRPADPDLVLDGALAEQIAALRVTCVGLQHETDRTVELARCALERPVVSNQTTSLMARSNVLNVLGFAYYVTGELAQAEQAYREARRVARESDFVLRELLVVHKLAHIYQVMGRLVEPYRLCQEALAQLQERGRQAFFAAGYLYCDLGHLLFEWNRLDEAEQMIAQSVRLNELVQVPHLMIDTYNARARLCLARGDLDAAQTALQQAADLIQKHYCWPEVVSANECYQVRLWLARGEVQSAARWAERCRPASSERLGFPHEMREIARARVLLAQGLPDEALSLLGRLASAAHAGGRTGRLIEVLALQALGLSTLRAGEKTQNTTRPELDLLEKGLASGRSEGFVRLYLDEGPSMVALLRQAAARGIEPDYVRKLLEAFPGRADSDGALTNGIRRPSGTHGVPAYLVEPLSEREIEVLHLMAQGLSNREIAEQLVVASGTVKAHVHNICGKLGVRNRTQAILQAQQLRLLT